MDDQNKSDFPLLMPISIKIMPKNILNCHHTIVTVSHVCDTVAEVGKSNRPMYATIPYLPLIDIMISSRGTVDEVPCHYITNG